MMVNGILNIMELSMEEWQDGRTSMKNIGEYAHQLGEKLKGKVKCCIDDTTKVDT